VQCVLLAFGDHPQLEERFQLEHAAARTPYDAIRALLRLVAWLGFAWRAAARGAAAHTVAAMVAAAVGFSLAPMALLAASPSAFLRRATAALLLSFRRGAGGRGGGAAHACPSHVAPSWPSSPPVLTLPMAMGHRWRRYWVGAWNLAQSLVTVAFYAQLHEPAPAGATPAASSAGAAGAAAAPPPSLPAALRSLLVLLWHGHALVMLLHAAWPLTNTLRYFVHAQLLVLMVHLRHNDSQCGANPRLRQAAADVHSLLLLPCLRGLARAVAAALPGSAAARAASVAAAYTAPPTELCSAYLPALQLCLGMGAACVLLYCKEAAARADFLASCSMRPDPVVLRREVGLALLVAALQLAAFQLG
jgi:hypothetical protein